jgi:hypothetical protein
MIDRLTSILSRAFFTVAFILLLIAVSDKILNIFGWSWTWMHYGAGKLFEFSAMLMIFVVVLLLRQIRERLGNTSK